MAELHALLHVIRNQGPSRPLPAYTRAINAKPGTDRVKSAISLHAGYNAMTGTDMPHAAISLRACDARCGTDPVYAAIGMRCPVLTLYMVLAGCDTVDQTAESVGQTRVQFPCAGYCPTCLLCDVRYLEQPGSEVLVNGLRTCTIRYSSDGL
eukprot:1163169-Rhodomonas_salina.3